ncbi:COX6A, subunit VIa of cytochrome c oxidase [Phlebopus sp. FC_14]|nr:COX6A, subunit VIa of cytochrome c oxidase [Phlebopus sp. FC_14]
MSFFARSAAARVLLRTSPKGSRTIVVDTPPPPSDYHAKQEALIAHAKVTAELWRKVSIYIAMPAIVVAALWVNNVESEHAAHAEHLMAENDGKLPQPPPYEYLNRRVKPFPWGDNSLFFNPKVNKDMEQAE